ncbi:oxidoreductase [Cesiribacter sp. SM1]|uniref:oxidoreductase n=1 Tax=Cesiribacter sp. SM1 TaxID=2861196 RepID=UPI001CD6B176
MNVPSPTDTFGQRTALIAGATGLVGWQLLNLLLSDPYYDRVYVLTRRKLTLEHPKLEQLVIDFDTLADRNLIPEVQDVYCCLGTTMKKAGSKEAFRKVDFTYPYELAKLAANNGAHQFLLVTAMGANKSSLFFYNRVKGDVEEAICKISQYRTIHVFRPSLLLGRRQDDRKGEAFAQKITRIIRPLMVGPFRKYRPIQGHVVAEGMLAAAKSDQRGIMIHASEEIKKLGQKRLTA